MLISYSKCSKMTGLGNIKEMAFLYVSIFICILEDFFTITSHQVQEYIALEVACVL